MVNDWQVIEIAQVLLFKFESWFTDVHKSSALKCE